MCLAVPGRLISVHGDAPLLRVGKVAFSGVIKEASLSLLPEAREGDYVLVHAGFAIAVIDEAAALRALDDLAAAGALPGPPEGEA